MELESQLVNERGLSQNKVEKRDSEWAASIFRSALGPLNCLESV